MLQLGHFSTNRENSQRAKYGQAATILGVRFIPLVLETYWNVGSAFSLFLGKLSGELFRQEPNLDPDVENYFKQRLRQLWINEISVCFQRVNARLILSKISRAHQVNQRYAPRVAVDFTGCLNNPFRAFASSLLGLNL